MLCIGEELVQRRTGTRRDHIEALRRHLFHAGVAHDRVQPQPVAHRFEKPALLGRRLEERHLNFAAQNFGQNEPGKSGSAAEIHQCLRARWHIAGELGAIPDVAMPDIRKRPGRDEIVAGVPVLEQTDIGLQPRERFT